MERRWGKCERAKEREGDCVREDVWREGERQRGDYPRN